MEDAVERGCTANKFRIRLREVRVPEQRLASGLEIHLWLQLRAIRNRELRGFVRNRSGAKTAQKPAPAQNLFEIYSKFPSNFAKIFLNVLK